MPNGDIRDGFFYPTLTLMIDSYIIQHFHCQGKTQLKVLLLVLWCSFCTIKINNLWAISMEPDQTALMEQSDMVTQRLLKRLPKYNRGQQNINV